MYAATKRALTYFTRGLEKELAGTPVCAGRLSPGLVLTEFITKAPDRSPSPTLENKAFKKVINALGQRPGTIAAYFVPRILKNSKNGAHIR